jgi:hypothetical protein
MSTNERFGRCSIAPPDILIQVAERGRTREDRDAATRTLAASAALHARRGLVRQMIRQNLASVASLMPTSTGEQNTVYDVAGGGSQQLPGTRERGQGDPPSDDIAVNQAWEGADETYRFYSDVLGRNSVDDRGMELVSSVHFGSDFDNAFWNGTQMVYGDGSGRIFVKGGLTAAIDVIAHELTHTIQQGAAVQRSPADGRMVVQRDEDKRSWWEKLTDFGESFAWDMVRTVAPSAVPILQKGPSGVLDWIGEKVSAAVDGVFNALMAPVRAISGVGDTLSALFAPMLATLQTAAGQIARNDCSPLREAAEKVEKTAISIITPIVEKLQPVVAKVKEFLNGLWDKIGAPIWGWIKDYAQEQWNQIQWLAGVIKDFYVWIWEKTAWVRDIAAKAWTWITAGAESSGARVTGDLLLSRQRAAALCETRASAARPTCFSQSSANTNR